jgi:hypothetical protein
VKKIKIEKSMTEEKNATPSNINSVPVQFVQAGKMVNSIAEISDEELLQYTLEFERKHKI